jgi:hypothetical protein
METCILNWERSEIRGAGEHLQLNFHYLLSFHFHGTTALALGRRRGEKENGGVRKEKEGGRKKEGGS